MVKTAFSESLDLRNWLFSYRIKGLLIVGLSLTCSAMVRAALGTSNGVFQLGTSNNGYIVSRKKIIPCCP